MNRKRLFFFIFLTLFVFMNNVNAIELNENIIISNSCSKNLFKPANWDVIGFKSAGIGNFTLVNRSEISTSYSNANNYVSEVLIPVEYDKYYCFSQEEDLIKQTFKIRYLNENFEDLGRQSSIYAYKVSGSSQCLYIDNTDKKYLLLYYSVSDSYPLETLKSTNFQVELNEVTDYVPYKECVVEEPDSEVNPEGLEIITIFYTVYLDRLVNFVSIVSTNYVLLSFIVVIVVFIVFELFFKMFRR